MCVRASCTLRPDQSFARVVFRLRLLLTYSSTIHVVQAHPLHAHSIPSAVRHAPHEHMHTPRILCGSS